MFSLFRKNDPYLYVLYSVAIIAGRVCFYLVKGELAIPADFQQSFLFDGLAMAQISAFWHCILNISVLLINAVLINILMQSNNALKENNYLGGFIYILLMSSSSALFLFSPALLGSTFILLALNLVLSHVKQRASEENIFFSGFFLGLSAIIYSPFLPLLFALLLIYFFYTRTIRRRYFLAIFGFLFPYLVTYTLSFFLGFDFELDPFIGQALPLEIFSISNPMSILFMGLPLLISFYELGNNFSGKRMTNHQLHFQRVMFTIMLFAIFIISVWNVPFGASSLVIIAFSYFLTQAILGVQKLWIRELLSLIVLLHVILPYLLTANF